MHKVPATTVAVLLFVTWSHAADIEWPSADWQVLTPQQAGLNEELLVQARDYALKGDGAGLITRHGKLVMRWGDTKERFDLKSTTKSIGVTALGLAIADSRLSLEDKVIDRHPRFGVPPESNQATGWLQDITIQHLATQTAGFEKPGGYGRLLFKPGTAWLYSDGGPNWLAECVTLAYQQDVLQLMRDRVFNSIGIGERDLMWRENAYRPRKLAGITRREFGSGVHANVDAMARLGLLYLCNGRWKDKQIIPESFVYQATHTVDDVVPLPEHVAHHGDASAHYGLLWWNNADGAIPSVPKNTFWSWGLYESLIVVMPEHQIVVSRAGKSWPRQEGAEHYAVLAPFMQAIAGAVADTPIDPQDAESQTTTAVHAAPYPPSSVIASIDWDDANQIIRRAKGSDNWPLTWADDGQLYGAYGDGRGFEPFVPQKLSMGFARVIGQPPELRGLNIPSETGDALGDGRTGRKASGMLMIEGVLYVFVRNVNNSQLGWSLDRGHSWDWADWKFKTSFGYPTFLNFGQDYAGARDDYVYIFSHDANTAYEAADEMVMARVSKERIRDRAAYEFFVRLDPQCNPLYTREIEERGPVFGFPASCHRSSISYNAGLKRYLWCQVLPRSRDPRGPRFAGGFGIYDGPQPWGPWTTAYFASAWDVGPGETNCIPTKWISHDGRTVHLVFSGDDAFSVRRGTIQVTPQRN